MWCHLGAVGQGSDFFKNVIFSESLFSFCLHESIMSFYLSSLAREHIHHRCGISHSLLPHFIAVGNYGSCRSLAKRAKICSWNKSSGTAVVPAKHWAVTHFLLVLVFATSQLWLEPGTRRPLPPYPQLLGLLQIIGLLMGRYHEGPV